MTDETRIALMNYDWMIRNRGLDYAALDWQTGTLIYGDGGAVIDELCRPGFTDATTPEGLAAAGAPDADGPDWGGDPPF
jgi:hypothetical protein